MACAGLKIFHITIRLCSIGRMNETKDDRGCMVSPVHLDELDEIINLFIHPFTCSVVMMSQRIDNNF